MFKYIDEKFTIFLEWTLIISINLVAILMAAQVIMRYIFHMPVAELEEAMIIPGIWFYILGSVYASKREEHLNARIIEIFFKNIKSIAKLRAATAALTFVVCSWLIYWSYDLCKYSLKVKKLSPILGYRMSIIEVSLFVGFIFMLFYILVEFIKYVNVVSGKRKGLE